MPTEEPEKLWWPLKVVNEPIQVAVFATSFEEAKSQFEEQLQRLVDETPTEPV